jgi:signal transduction histidine kinase
MLYMPEPQVAYKLWNNGKLVKQCGVVSDSAKTSRLSLANALIPIEADNGSVELVMQMSSYEFLYGGLSGSPLLGSFEAVQMYFLRTRGFYLFALGCVLMMAIYHLALYVFRRDHAYILFAVMCALCFARYLYEKNGLLEYFQWIETDLNFWRQYFALLLLHTSSIAVFALYAFDRDFLSRKWRLIALYTIFSVLLEVLIPRDNAFARPSILLLGMPLVLCSIAVALRSPVLREEKWTRLYLAALILYFFVGIGNKALFDSDFFMLGLLNNLFMIMSQSFVLSKRYAKAFELVESTNANLEGLVSERTKNLQATTNAMRELIANISHDLKTPLTVLSVNLEQLHTAALSLGDDRMIETADVAWYRNLDLQRLTQNLLEASRIEAGRSLYAPEWASLSWLCLMLRNKYEGFLERNELYLDVSYAEDAFLWCDTQKIWNVFDNIIYNAVRHTKDGGITITVELTEETAIVSVQDSGVGIAPEHLPRIFERFYKAGSARGSSNGDSGLGLYIVKSAMEAIGGSVRAESEIGRGTAIILTFRKRA